MRAVGVRIYSYCHWGIEPEQHSIRIYTPLFGIALARSRHLNLRHLDSEHHVFWVSAIPRQMFAVNRTGCLYRYNFERVLD